MDIGAKLLAAVFFGVASSSAHAFLTLYDGTKTGLPETQGWLAYESLTGTGTQTLSAGNIGPVTLDTTAGNSNSEYAGLSNFGAGGTLVNPAFPTLSPSKGFDLTFNADLESEAHASTDRAGFCVILLGSDLNGIELGFWSDQIWAQATNANPALDFTHAEGTTNFNASAGFYHYDLHIQGSAYTLSADGSPILSGATRNYSGYPLPAGYPYTIPDFVFLGDDTSSARGTVGIESIGVSVPEPTTIALFFTAGVSALGRRRRK